MKAKYGDKMDFIHQEVYVDNDVSKGLREPLRQFNLPTEPWLFVVDKSGKITARLEGSIGVAAVRGRGQDRPVRKRAPRRSRRRSPPLLLAAGGRRGARPRPAPAAADPAVAVRVGRRRGARRSRSSRWPCCGRRRGWSRTTGAPLPGGQRVARACRVQILCGRDRRRAAGRHDPGRLPRLRHGAGQLGADVHPDHVLGRAGVRSILFGDVFRAFSPWRAIGRLLPSLNRPVSRAARALAGRGRAVRSSPGSSSCPAGARTRRRSSPRRSATRCSRSRRRSYWGVETWTRRGEAFAVYFNMFSRMSILEMRDGVLGLRRAARRAAAAGQGRRDGRVRRR